MVSAPLVSGYSRTITLRNGRGEGRIEPVITTRPVVKWFGLRVGAASDSV